MHSLIAAQRPAIANICRRYQVRRLEVFGSAARGTDFDPERSDADFLVEFAPDAQADLGGWFSVRTELEHLLGRGVDLVEYRAVRNPYVRVDIERTRELIYAT
ncbi:MAG: nucleotidyltransferase domain-containing protein [Thiocapsa sp.]|uniref:nucleotidyltransferase family protein n=1 Tax=Thiocapsa sp. TaxID=2024551 RepID=UPI001BCC7173|nr:nucleotidyltransferase domain-containing protein [Thiocapsa sp.]QVL50926.1 MAG: nucleotidyltransferase domain-containing protein [Thiocapsa sp.]